MPRSRSITIFDSEGLTNTGYRKLRGGTLFVRVIDKYGNLYFPSGHRGNRLLLAVSARFVYKTSYGATILIFVMYPFWFFP